jgi:hypothetical protein
MQRQPWKRDTSARDSWEVNLKTAKALGLTIPSSDQVIE